MVVGLSWQVVSMCLFMGLWADFALRVRRACRVGGLLDDNGGVDRYSPFLVLRNSTQFKAFQICKPLSLSLLLQWSSVPTSTMKAQPN